MIRLNILISAHELSPDQGSECAEGWNLVTRISKYHNVTVLYAQGSQFEPTAYQKAVEAWSKENQQPVTSNLQPTFIAIPQPKRTLRLAAINKKLSKRSTGVGIPALYYMGYKAWQKAAYKKAKELLETCAMSPEPYHLVHHLTQISFREPGYLWKLGIPFVWGPTGGLESVPFKFALIRSIKTAAFEVLRKSINNITFKIKPRIGKALKSSSLIYTFSQTDRKRFLEAGGKKVELMLDSGCETQVAPTSRDLRFASTGFKLRVAGSQGSDRLQVIWVGQLIERKALDILINAINGSEELKERCEVTIVGSGSKPATSRSEAKIPTCRGNQQPATSNFTYTGQLPREEVIELMKRSDILVHTSYREATTHVIPEALSIGLPIICHDIGGMSVAVNEECGIKVPLRSHNESVLGFRNALLQIEGSRLQVELSAGARRRGIELSWNSMAEKIANDYVEIVKAG